MNLKRQHWIVGGGVSLAATLWLMNGLTQTLFHVGELSLTATGVFIAFWWLRQQAAQAQGTELKAALPDRQAVNQSLLRSQSLLDQLAEEGIESSEAQQALLRLQTEKNVLGLDLERQELRLALVGGQGTGKTTLARLLEQQSLPCNLHIQDLSGLTPWSGELSRSVPALAADLVLFLTTGDLTESDLRILQSLRSQSPFFVVLNKQDHYLPGQQAVLLQQVQQRLQGIVPTGDVVAIAAAPAPIKVRRQQEDGSWQEWFEQPQPSLSPLLRRLEELLTTEEARQQLVWTTTYRQTQQLQQSTHGILNQVRRDRALTLIEKYQWIAAGAAFVNPVPSLDLLATLGITGHLIWDLGKLYRQSFSLNQAQEVAATVAEMVVKLGLVEVSTQALTAALKTNGLTFWIGSGLQGVSAAYLTRMAGLSLVEYFEALDPLSSEEISWGVDRLRTLLQKVFATHQKADLLKAFAQTAWEKLKSQTSGSGASLGVNPNPVA